MTYARLGLTLALACPAVAQAPLAPSDPVSSYRLDVVAHASLGRDGIYRERPAGGGQLRAPPALELRAPEATPQPPPCEPPVRKAAGVKPPPAPCPLPPR